MPDDYRDVEWQAWAIARASGVNQNGEKLAEIDCDLAWIEVERKMLNNVKTDVVCSCR